MGCICSSLGLFHHRTNPAQETLGTHRPKRSGFTAGLRTQKLNRVDDLVPACSADYPPFSTDIVEFAKHINSSSYLCSLFILRFIPHGKKKSQRCFTGE